MCVYICNFERVNWLHNDIMCGLWHTTARGDIMTLWYAPFISFISRCHASLLVHVVNVESFPLLQTIRHWDVSTGLCMRVVRVSKLHPVMALHWEKVCCYYSCIISVLYIHEFHSHYTSHCVQCHFLRSDRLETSNYMCTTILYILYASCKNWPCCLCLAVLGTYSINW